MFSCPCPPLSIRSLFVLLQMENVPLDECFWHFFDMNMWNMMVPPLVFANIIRSIL